MHNARARAHARGHARARAHILASLSPRHGTTRYDTVRRGTARRGMAWHDMARCARHGATRRRRGAVQFLALFFLVVLFAFVPPFST